MANNTWNPTKWEDDEKVSTSLSRPSQLNGSQQTNSQYYSHSATNHILIAGTNIHINSIDNMQKQKAPQGLSMISNQPYQYYTSSAPNSEYPSQFGYHEDGINNISHYIIRDPSVADAESTTSNTSMSMQNATSLSLSSSNSTNNLNDSYLREQWSSQYQYASGVLRTSYGITSPDLKHYTPSVENLSEPNYYHKKNGRRSSGSNSKRSTSLSSEITKSHSLDADGFKAKSVTKRSRMGCLTCRMRKKRCCEIRPKCTECNRLGLNCVWPKPGTEHKNKPKDAKQDENTINHEIYGKIRVLRGIVEYKSQMSS